MIIRLLVLTFICITSLPRAAFANELTSDDVTDETSQEFTSDEDEAEAVQQSTLKPSRTKLSSQISDKLSIFASASLGSVKKDGEDWGAFGQSGLGLGWKLSQIGSYKVSVTARYSPADVRPTLDRQAYSGVLEAFHVGAIFGQTSSKMEWFGSAEVGVFIPMLQDADTLQDPETIAEPGIALSLGGGAMFSVVEKVAAGPVVHVGFGSFNTMQLGAQASFAF